MWPPRRVPAPPLRAGVHHRLRRAVEVRLREGAEDDEVISLCGALPAAECFPSETMLDAMRRIMERAGAAALQYGWPDGFEPLRRHILAWMRHRGVDGEDLELMVTNGAQQGLHFLSRLLLEPGAPLAVEVPTYNAALQCFDLRRPTWFAVPRDAGGLDLEALERALRAGVRVVYLVATGHNPTGGVLSTAERLAVLDLVERWDAWVVDDDAYGSMVYEPPAPPPLRAHGRHLHRLVHLGSFSKVLAPGLRLGWIAGPPELVHQAVVLKQAQDLETATLTQRVLSGWLDANDLRTHVTGVLRTYRSRRDALVEALRIHAPPELRWEVPAAGFSLLLHTSAPDASALALDALDHGVLVEPAGPFYVDAEGRGALRLSFANTSEEDLEAGVGRLLAAWAGHRPAPPPDGQASNR